MGFKGEEGRVRAEARALLDYDAARPPEGGPAEAEGLTASSLPLLDGAGLHELTCTCGICHTPHQRTSMAQGLFKVDLVAEP